MRELLARQRQWSGSVIVAAIVVAVTLGSTLLLGAVSMLQERQMVATDKDEGKEISISSATTLTIKLPAQMGTGYSWSVSEMDKSFLSLIGEPRIESTDTAGVGRQELQVLTFKPLKAGSSTLKLHYIRSWEKPAKPGKVYSLTVSVK